MICLGNTFHFLSLHTALNREHSRSGRFSRGHGHAQRSRPRRRVASSPGRRGPDRLAVALRRLSPAVRGDPSSRPGWRLARPQTGPGDAGDARSPLARVGTAWASGSEGPRRDGRVLHFGDTWSRSRCALAASAGHPGPPRGSPAVASSGVKTSWGAGLSTWGPGAAMRPANLTVGSEAGFLGPSPLVASWAPDPRRAPGGGDAGPRCRGPSRSRTGAPAPRRPGTAAWSRLGGQCCVAQGCAAAPRARPQRRQT